MIKQFSINDRVVELTTDRRGTVVETAPQRFYREHDIPDKDRDDGLILVHWDYSNQSNYIHKDLIGVIAAVTMPNYTSSKLKRVSPHVH